MAAQQNQINLGKENLIPLQVWCAASLFLLFPGLFEIIAQSAHVSAIPSVNVCGGCEETVASWLFALWDIV